MTNTPATTPSAAEAPDVQISVRLPAALLEKVDVAAAALSINRANMIRLTLAKYVQDKDTAQDLIRAETRSGELERRATAIYGRDARRLDGAANQPGACEVVEHDDQTYVRFTNVNGTLAVYLVHVVKGKTKLAALEQWPQELD